MEPWRRFLSNSERPSDKRARPTGPKGDKRPAEVIGAAIMAAKIATGKIATGEIEDTLGKSSNRAKGGKIDGAKRADSLSAEQRKAIVAKCSAL